MLNLSLGTSDEADYRRDFLAWAAEQLWKDGIAVVAAAGNEGDHAHVLDMPAADPYVIAVGATDTGATPDPADDRVADFSSRSELRGPDVVAPGTGIVSLRVPGSTLDEEFPGARVGDGFFRGSGTSQAAAVVSGLAARLLSQRPELTNDQLKALLEAGAVDLADPASADGAGRVDVGRSEALATPDARTAEQKWPASLPDLKRLFKRGKKELDTGAATLERPPLVGHEVVRPPLVGDEVGRHEVERAGVGSRGLTRAALPALAGAIAVAAVALFAFVVRDLPGYGVGPHIPWWALAAAFAATELFVVHAHVRGSAHSLSISELPLILGLLLASPQELVVAQVLGPAIVLALTRGHSPLEARLQPRAVRPHRLPGHDHAARAGPRAAGARPGPVGWRCSPPCWSAR